MRILCRPISEELDRKLYRKTGEMPFLFLFVVVVVIVVVVFFYLIIICEIVVNLYYNIGYQVGKCLFNLFVGLHVVIISIAYSNSYSFYL